MALVVTGVGALIHVYSIGYMEHDERYQRFFFYLNFFILAMLILVMSDNFLGMFVGWEGVGLASFLLIGFWFDQRDDIVRLVRRRRQEGLPRQPHRRLWHDRRHAGASGPRWARLTFLEVFDAAAQLAR